VPKRELTKRETKLIDARVELVQKVWGDVPKLYSHAVLVHCGLPYRNPGDDARHFTRSSGAFSLRIEAGALPAPGGGFVEVGMPYGARARLLLLHLCADAVKQQSPVVEVADSFTAFAKSIGLNTSGRNLRSLRDQINRMSVVSMRLAKRGDGYTDVFQGPVFSKLRAELPPFAEQLPLWTSHIEFSPDFYSSLERNAVPLRKEAIYALKHSARALDIYCWLAHRLYRVDFRSPVSIKWTTLRHQFGEPSQKMESWKRAFIAALKQALEVYPQAKVERIHGGLLLKNSLPPVPQRNKGLLE